MKIRLGFVSNSSSSSFVAIMTKESFDKAYKNADELTKFIVDELASEPEKLGNEEVVMMGDFCDMGGGSNLGYMEEEGKFEKFKDNYKDKDEFYDAPYEALHDFISKTDHVTHNEDW